MGVDWAAWVARFEDPGGPDGFAGLFADGGLFCDPVTPWTEDVRKVAEDTERLFPDWRSTVDRLLPGGDWAVIEWTGTGTYQAGTPEAVVVTIHGATVVEVDEAGQVVRWRDYLDTNEPMNQIGNASG